jgi:hypothetical protein
MFKSSYLQTLNVFCTGDNMNTFLNENWKELVRDLAPAIGEAFGEVVKKILTTVFFLVPYDEAFPEKV